MRKLLLVILLFTFYNGLPAQKVSNPLKKYEISLLDLLFSNSEDFSFTIDNNKFSLGTDLTGATFVNINKHKNTVYIQPLGTGKLYKLNKKDNDYQIERIDSTIHSGINFFSKNIFVRDTVFQVGGLGFWSIRGFITYFSELTHQWELVQSNASVPVFFDKNHDAIIQSYTEGNNPRLYLSNSYKYPKFPESFDMIGTDSCYLYEFNSRKWSRLGSLNKELGRILYGQNPHTFQFGKYLLFQSQLDFFWVNFEKNAWGKIKSKYNNELRQIWLSLYNNESKEGQNFGQYNFQFNIKNQLYFIRLNNKEELNFKTYTINEEMIDFGNAAPIYSDKINYISIITNFLDDYKTILLSILAIVAITIFVLKSSRRKNKMPKEVVSILNNNFFSALTIVEKELIEVLYQHHLKGEALSTKLINKIIGVQQKDTLTQNKSRSDYFIRINQKFKMSTQHTEPLIIKHRDSTDKRQYNYSINPIYIEDVAKLLND